jgi:cell division protease FtsH
MFSGADLAAIINEGAIAATLHNKDWIEQEDLEEARDKVKFGRARTSWRQDKGELRATAYHEAGHAVLQSMLPDADPLHKVTIIPRGKALGATFSLPEKDRVGYGFKWLSATMRMMCGGRIAELRASGDIASGAASDIAQVTRLARAMVLDWGMSPRLGFVKYSGDDTREMYLPEKGYSEETARIVDEEIKRLADEAYRDAQGMLNANWEKVEAVAEALLRYETLSADEVARAMRGEAIGKPTIAELLSAETKKRRDEVGPSGKGAGDRKPEAPPDALPSPV